jgi:hypothetical protein
MQQAKNKRAIKNIKNQNNNLKKRDKVVFSLTIGALGTNDGQLGVRVLVVLVEGFTRADDTRALVTHKALLVKVLALKDQVGLAGRDQFLTLSACLALADRVAGQAERLVLLVRVDALTDEFSGALRAHQTIVVVLVVLECHDRVEDGLCALFTTRRVLD